MKPVLLLYATREGHTQHVADHVAAFLRSRGISVEELNAKAFHEPFDASRYSGIVLAASIHLTRHEPEMVAFVKRHHAELVRVPAAFLSVSLSEAGVENLAATPEMRAQSMQDVARMLEAFYSETGWHPAHVCPVAGALLYTKYGIILRYIMKRIARKAGASQDTAHDHIFTDWAGLDRFIGDFITPIEEESAAAPAPSLTT